MGSFSFSGKDPVSRFRETNWNFSSLFHSILSMKDKELQNPKDPILEAEVKKQRKCLMNDQILGRSFFVLSLSTGDKKKDRK